MDSFCIKLLENKAIILKISTKPILKNEFSELIEFDKIHFFQYMKNAGLHQDELPPLFTEVDIEKSYDRGDQIEWILVNDHTKGGYFWFEVKPDCLFIVGIAIQQAFYGVGMAQYVLELAEKKARDAANLTLCRLVVIPLNGRAIKCYLNNGYRIVKFVSAFWGPQYPNTSRFIMEKSLSGIPVKVSLTDTIEIVCTDKENIQKVIDSGYIGIQLVRGKNNADNRIIFKK
jgi:ribosomal protein S18 acetylase RimI-like enzyme